MNSHSLINRFRRLKDFDYINFLINFYIEKFKLIKSLSSLEKYHLGKIKNFKNERNRKLWNIIKYAYKKTSYYKKMINDVEINVKNFGNLINNWEQLPLLDKKIIKNEKENILALPVDKNFVTYVTTGGSTGEPFGFYMVRGHDWEHQEFLFKLMGYKRGDKILSMDGSLVSEKNLKNNIYWTELSKNDLPYGSFAMSSHYLTNDNVNYYIDFIKEFKPSFIRGYPSFLEIIGKHIILKNIKFDFQLKGVELTAETFYDYQIDLLKRAFNCKVFSQYGHSESCVFGYSINEDQTVYCSPFYGYTEIIGNDNRHVKIGEIGEIVVTGFYNYACPFIRYKTGDLGLYGGEDNGIVKLKQIYGRTQDIIYSTNMEEIRLTALVFGRHYKAFSNIDKWQIIQNTPGKIIFKIVKGKDFSDADKNELSQNFMQIAQIKTEFEFIDKIDLTIRGKSKLLIQNIVV